MNWRKGPTRTPLWRTTVSSPLTTAPSTHKLAQAELQCSIRSGAYRLCSGGCYICVVKGRVHKRILAPSCAHTMNSTEVAKQVLCTVPWVCCHNIPTPVPLGGTMGPGVRSSPPKRGWAPWGIPTKTHCRMVLVDQIRVFIRASTSNLTPWVMGLVRLSSTHFPISHHR